MNSRKLFIWIVLVATVLTAAKSSILLQRSLLRPKLQEPCFTCRAEDRPYSYTLISYFGKIKDIFVRAINKLAEKAKNNRLE